MHRPGKRGVGDGIKGVSCSKEELHRPGRPNSPGNNGSGGSRPVNPGQKELHRNPVAVSHDSPVSSDSASARVATGNFMVREAKTEAAFSELLHRVEAGEASLTLTRPPTLTLTLTGS